MSDFGIEKGTDYGIGEAHTDGRRFGKEGPEFHSDVEMFLYWNEGKVWIAKRSDKAKYPLRLENEMDRLRYSTFYYHHLTTV